MTARNPTSTDRPGARPRDETIALARVLDPLAYDERTEVTTLGQQWDRQSRRLTAEQHARRALAAGCHPPAEQP